jgi:hypothetical protein
MLALSLLICLVALLITILNVFSLITPRHGGYISQKVSVLVPLRNEEENAVAIVDIKKNRKIKPLRFINRITR